MELSILNLPANKEKQLRSKSIETVEDLALFLPRQYMDFQAVRGLHENELSAVVVKMTSLRCSGYRDDVTLNATCTVAETAERVRVTWFHSGYLYKKLDLMVGSMMFVVGKPTYSKEYSNWQFTNPVVFSPDISLAAGIQPVYSKIRGMADDYLRATIQKAIAIYTPEETLPESLRSTRGLPELGEAVRNLHTPKTRDSLAEAKKRMVYDSMLYFAAKMELSASSASPGSQYSYVSLATMNKVKASLPYKLTDDQEKILTDMLACIKQGRRLNALLQADVGAGKTIVAFLLMLSFYDAGYQSVIMAPTQVLARQHYEDLKNLVEPFGIRVAFLGGKMKKSEEKEILREIRCGEYKLIVGTHAVISNKVKYKNLALAIADEEHKFGVLQRETLTSAAAAGTHSLTMSATPIPRSLAQVIYGSSIQLHTIQTMPAGRLPVKTATTSSMSAIFSFLQRELAAGHQAYVVCPMIDSGEEDMRDVASVTEIHELYRKALEPLHYKVAMLTGRDKADDAEAVIAAFKRNEIQVLVATTVIEVGVNVPNATVMIVHSADRFGLSGLHQLRGRVGRGKLQSYCVLHSAQKGNERLRIMCETTNGYEIARADLTQRGAGELVGTKQHGNDALVSLMLSFPGQYATIKEDAKTLVETGQITPVIKMYDKIISASLSEDAKKKRTARSILNAIASYAADINFSITALPETI